MLMSAVESPIAGQIRRDLVLEHQDSATVPDSIANTPYASNSQLSSSNVSIASQASFAASASNDTSLSSIEHPAPSEEPPLSARSAVLNGARPGNPPGQVETQWTNARSPTQRARGGALRAYQADATHAQKRTASGHVKAPSASLPTSPIDSLNNGHVRTASTASNGTQISELSSQLRTHLSYAMVKVQKGWENRTIDELEGLSTPVSAATSPRQRPFGSPAAQTMEPYNERLGFAQSSERTTLAPGQALTAPHSHSHSFGNDYTYIPTSRSSGYSEQPRPLDASSGFGAGTSALPGGSAPSLAPPVDLVSRHPRRTNPSYPHPELAAPRNLSNLSTSSTSSSSVKSVIPATPPPRVRPTIKTPSQRATAMEKEAVETLLFMSSPGNSQYRPPSSHLPATPLRNAFSAVERRVGFIDEDDGMPISPRKKGLLESANLENDEDIDRVLDQMPDDASSSEEDELLQPQRSIPTYA